MLSRIRAEEKARQDGDYSFRTFSLVHSNINFESAPVSLRIVLADKCLQELLNSEGIYAAL